MTTVGDGSYSGPINIYASFCDHPGSGDVFPATTVYGTTLVGEPSAGARRRYRNERKALRLYQAGMRTDPPHMSAPVSHAEPWETAPGGYMRGSWEQVGQSVWSIHRRCRSSAAVIR